MIDIPDVDLDSSSGNTTESGSGNDNSTNTNTGANNDSDPTSNSTSSNPTNSTNDDTTNTGNSIDVDNDADPTSDYDPPTIILPTDIVTEATGPLTDVGLGTPIVSDQQDPTPVITNNAPSDGFPIGTTIVTWTATDASGNSAAANQNVTIHDTTPPSIIPSSDITIEVDGTIALIELELPIVSDLVDDSPAVVNDAPEDSLFPIGITIVTWTAADEFGNFATATQSVVVIESNNPPIANAGSDQVTNEADLVTLNGTGSNDLDGDALTYSWSQTAGPAVTLVGANTANSTFIAPNVDSSGVILTFELIVSDGSATSSDTVSIVVNNVVLTGGYTYLPSSTFSGSNYFDTPDSASLRLDRFSVASWFKTSEDYYIYSGMIVNKGGLGGDATGQNMNYGIWMDSLEHVKGGFESASGTDYYVISPNSYSDGKWHYAVVTFDGTAVKLYVDGILTGSLATAGAQPETIGTYPLRIGANAKDNDKHFVGEIDEVRVWNRAISETEVVEQYELSVFKTNGMLVYINGVQPNNVDVTPPSVTITTPTGGQILSSTSITVTGTASDNIEVSSVQISVDGGAYQDVSGKTSWSYSISNLAQGSHTITVRAKDAANNMGTATAAFAISLPQTPVPEPQPSGYTVPTIGGIKPTSITYGSTVHTVCDSGCTHTTIKSAIDALPSGGGKVILKGPKTFTLSSTVYLRSNLVLEWESGVSISYSGSGKVFSGTNVNNVMFINPVITRTNADDVIYLRNVDTVIIQGGSIKGIKGSSSSGIECKSCKNLLVQDGNIMTFSRPIDVGTITKTRDGTTNNIWIVHNTVRDASIECVKINKGINMHAISNTVSDCGNNGIDVGYNQGAEAKNNKITSAGMNSVDNAVGIHTDSSDTVVIRDNIIDKSGTEGISVCGSDNNYVLYNTVTNSGQRISVFTGEGFGIETTKCEAGTTLPNNTTIDGNIIKFNAKGGVYIGQGSTNAKIINNTFVDNGSSGDKHISGNTSAIIEQKNNTFS
jgi:parallel beta-helix repeat protein